MRRRTTHTRPSRRRHGTAAHPPLPPPAQQPTREDSYADSYYACRVPSGGSAVGARPTQRRSRRDSTPHSSHGRMPHAASPAAMRGRCSGWTRPERVPRMAPRYRCPTTRAAPLPPVAQWRPTGGPSVALGVVSNADLLGRASSFQRSIWGSSTARTRQYGGSATPFFFCQNKNKIRMHLFKQRPQRISSEYSANLQK